MDFVARISHPVIRPSASIIPPASRPSACSQQWWLSFLKNNNNNNMSDAGGGDPEPDAFERNLELLLETLESAQVIVNSPRTIADQFEPIPLGPNVTFFTTNRGDDQHHHHHHEQANKKKIPEETLPSFLLPPAEADEQGSSYSSSSFVFGKRPFPTDDGYEGDELQQLQQQQEEETVSLLRPVVSEDDTSSQQQFRQYQEDQWRDRFQELAIFKQENGHCDVPHDFQCNPKLSQWVKRQRYQFKLKGSGRHSTLTTARESELEAIGFVWDAHDSSWAERIHSLRVFRDHYGHCRVPSKYEEDRPLAIWVKCQRRQMKLRLKGMKNSLNEKRISELIDLGFDWNPRNLPV